MGTFIVQSNMINEKIRTFMMETLQSSNEWTRNYSAKLCLEQNVHMKSEIYRDTCTILDEKQNEIMAAVRQRRFLRVWDNHLFPQLNDDLTGLRAAAFLFGPESR